MASGISGLLVEKVTGVGYATAVQRDLLFGNGDDRMVVQDAQLPPPPAAAPNQSDDLVKDGHFLPTARSPAPAPRPPGSPPTRAP
jgi:hypothetical protein